mmetsp:Transcript_15941/g.25463  ORF Transcript_15941/g.25463 Transcript_15941/m.25463 type:complete len:360 (-) Transcript_15941:560-1639(-)
MSLADSKGTFSGSSHSRLIHEASQVSSREAGRSLRPPHPVDGGPRISSSQSAAARIFKSQALRVSPDDLVATEQVWQRHCHLSVEPSGPRESLVQDVRSICGANDNHALCRVKPIHFGQKLCERSRSVRLQTTTAFLPTPPTDIVKLVDEDHRRRHGASNSEELLHKLSASACKSTVKICTGSRDERHSCSRCNRLCQQRLATARRSGQQKSLGALRSKTSKPGRSHEALDDLQSFGFCGADASHVLQRHVWNVRLEPCDLRRKLPTDCPQRQGLPEGIDKRLRNLPHCAKLCGSRWRVDSLLDGMAPGNLGHGARHTESHIFQHIPGYMMQCPDDGECSSCLGRPGQGTLQRRLSKFS